MADLEDLFYVLVADKCVQVQAQRDWNVATLLRHIQSPEYDPSPKLKSMKSSRCKFYTLSNPVEVTEDSPNIPEIMSSLQDTTKYTKVGHNKHVGSIAQSWVGRFLYLVIEDVSDRAETVNKLKQDHADLYRCLEVSVQVPGQWTWDDIGSNGGIFVGDEELRKPPKMLDVETRLHGKRTFDNWDDGPDLSSARRYEAQFASSYVQDTEGSATVKYSREFVAFYVLLSCYYPDAPRYKAAASSSLKAHALKANFILPPFFSGRNSTDNLAYQEEMPLKFPLFISCPAMSDIPRKYTPTSHFSVCFRQLDFPLIIAEVISEKSEQDRYRMLVQAIALARLAFYLRRPESTMHPFIVAIYLTAGLVAERYIVMKVESAIEVYITKKDFYLASEDGATAFQREMYNLASELDSVSNQLDATKRLELEAIKKGASGMMSLHSSGAWTATEQSRVTAMGPIIEETEEPQDEDNFGVFDDDNIHADLAQMNYKVAYIAFGHSNIAPIQSLTDGQLVGCLKFVKDGGKEVEILQYLASLDFESNHTVRPFHTWSITGGSVIAMPAAGNRLTKLDDKDTFLWPIMIQLFGAIKFMHDHNVAHMDLKPSNILVPSEYGSLTVVDFGVSVRVKTAGQLFQSKGRVGTEGYIAPEVGHTKFSPIRADLWSTGKVVEEFCMLCRPSDSRDWLLGLSKQLLDDDPSKRPMMSEVLRQMLNHGATEFLGDGHISSVAPMLSVVSAPMYIPTKQAIRV